MTSEGSWVELGDLHDVAERVLVAVGMPLEHAGWTAGAMVWADRHGRPAHGVAGKLGQCVRRIRAGGTTARPHLRVLQDLGAAVSVDADAAWGQVAGVYAMRTALACASAYGVGAVSVRNTSSAAAMGYYAWLAAEAGAVGVALTNGPPLVAPPGGGTRVLSNQGHAVASPGRDGVHLLHDSALTMISTGRMEALEAEGTPLPEGVARDATGAPTRDPGAWRSGVLETIGGAKGFGLAVAFEALTGLLSGGERFGPEVGHPGDHGAQQSVSLFCLAVDPRVAGGDADLPARLEHLRDAVHASASGAASTRLPGEERQRLARETSRVMVSPHRLAELRSLADEAGVDPLPVQPA